MKTASHSIAILPATLTAEDRACERAVRDAESVARDAEMIMVLAWELAELACYLDDPGTGPIAGTRNGGGA